MTNPSSVPVAEKDSLDPTLYIATSSVTKQTAVVRSIRLLIGPLELAFGARPLE